MASREKKLPAITNKKASDYTLKMNTVLESVSPCCFPPPPFTGRWIRNESLPGMSSFIPPPSTGLRIRNESLPEVTSFIPPPPTGLLIRSDEYDHVAPLRASVLAIPLLMGYPEYCSCPEECIRYTGCSPVGRNYTSDTVRICKICDDPRRTNNVDFLEQYNHLFPPTPAPLSASACPADPAGTCLRRSGAGEDKSPCVKCGKV